MAWAEIKKAVNSDLSTPLNTLITNLISQVKSYISTEGNVKVVKRVQRGQVNSSGGYGSSSVTITIAAVDMNKSIVIWKPTFYSSSEVFSSGQAYLTSSTTLVISYTYNNGYANSSARYSQVGSYEVIEFY